jgi:hypothetical protein
MLARSFWGYVPAYAIVVFLALWAFGVLGALWRRWKPPVPFEEEEFARCRSRYKPPEELEADLAKPPNTARDVVVPWYALRLIYELGTTERDAFRSWSRVEVIGFIRAWAALFTVVVFLFGPLDNLPWVCIGLVCVGVARMVQGGFEWRAKKNSVRTARIRDQLGIEGIDLEPPSFGGWRTPNSVVLRDVLPTP